MTIHLPQEVENSILAQVHSGHFASVDDAMTQAARLLLKQLEQSRFQATLATAVAKPDPSLESIEAMNEAAVELDENVADAMKRRQEPSGQAAGSHEAIPTMPGDYRPIWERVEELRLSIPAEEWDKLPVDGAEQLDHYNYGSPKRPAS